jgi:uncharacterized glyoxalase superfamily protein PhnB
MPSDGRETRAIDPEAGNVTLSLAPASSGEAERLFAALCDGGNVEMPFDTHFGVESSAV